MGTYRVFLRVECSREEAVVSPGRGMLGKPHSCNESCEERGQRAPAGWSRAPFTEEESPQEGVDLLQEGSTSTGREEQGV